MLTVKVKKFLYCKIVTVLCSKTCVHKQNLHVQIFYQWVVCFDACTEQLCGTFFFIGSMFQQNTWPKMSTACSWGQINRVKGFNGVIKEGKDIIKKVNYQQSCLFWIFIWTSLDSFYVQRPQRIMHESLYERNIQEGRCWGQLLTRSQQVVWFCQGEA